jgi:hypothetical protein
MQFQFVVISEIPVSLHFARQAWIKKYSINDIKILLEIISVNQPRPSADRLPGGHSWWNPEYSAPLFYHWQVQI